MQILRSVDFDHSFAAFGIFPPIIIKSACCVLCIRGTQLCKNGIYCNYYSSLDLDTSDAWKLNINNMAEFRLIKMIHSVDSFDSFDAMPC
jgi:hypothetical protein